MGIATTDQACHAANFVLNVNILLETSDLTCSLRSSTIIFPVSTSCCANMTQDGNHFRNGDLWNGSNFATVG